MARRSLLLVDDNAAYRRLTSVVVRDSVPEELDVREAATLAEAEATLASAPADVALLDLSLPDAHGLGCIGRVLTAGAAAVVVLSGRSDPGIAKAARAAGAAAYVLKGEEVDALPEVLPPLLAR